jgi:hypothetical protein
MCQHHSRRKSALSSLFLITLNNGLIPFQSLAFFERFRHAHVISFVDTFFLVDLFAEYATVGYMAKRIQMRKNRYLNMQKNNEAKKAEAFTAGLNFINILRAAFMCVDPKSAKRKSSHQSFFAFGICARKSTPKMLVKLIHPKCCSQPIR